MSNPSICIQVPGKLMVAGEFAVLEPHQKLIVMAVDRFVYATLEDSIDNQLTLESFELKNMKWHYKNHRVTIDSNDNRINFVEDAMMIACNYLQENEIPLSHFKLSVRSELDDESGIKYGLGSSAAVVTAVITAILKRHLSKSPTKDLIFKLAAISHVKTQGNGSGADIAASSYGGVLKYTSFQADWLLNEYQNKTTLTALIEKDWQYFSVQRIEFPEEITMCIGWTGKPASTARLVDEILQLKVNHPNLFQAFLTNSQEAVDLILQGMLEENFALLVDGVKKNRDCLATVGEDAGVEIETPLLSKLCNLAELYGGAGKPSGAGGGDCGIAFMPTKDHADKMRGAWEKDGIKPLHIQIHSFGAESTE